VAIRAREAIKDIFMGKIMKAERRDVNTAGAQTFLSAAM
jgi:hypothetical protein